MIKLMTLICEGMKLNPLTTFQELRRAKTITCYHASEDANFTPLDTPLHVGSLQQSLALIQNMKKSYGNKKFYLYELVVNLGEISPFMYDEDPQVDPDNSRYNSYAYSNRIEYPTGLHRGNNISVVIINPREQIESKRLVKALNEKYTPEDEASGNEFYVGEKYDSDAVFHYVMSQHPGFEDDDRIYGVFQCLEMNPKDIEESEYVIDDDKVEQLARSDKPFPPVVLNSFGWIIDGGHRLSAAKLRGDSKIKVLKQIRK